MHGTNNNNKNLQTSLQTVMEIAIGEVLQDYKTLFASSPQAMSGGDEANFSPSPSSILLDGSEGDLLARHKIGKAVLSHLEALLKIYDHWLGQPEKSADDGYKQSLIDEARDSLNPPPRSSPRR